ncbi:MAG: WYL domain-containing protein [Akkermansiaceae bacterium]|nr:WYL domain-containing protein [Akkermansiaceae bacterium]MCF7733032.1 WYL domain-containing protein [Akkermansiaceae bacterium]
MTLPNDPATVNSDPNQIKGGLEQHSPNSREHPSIRDPVFIEIKSTGSVPVPHMDYPTPETTPGVFLEHFDLSPPTGDGQDGIIYGHLFKNAKEAAEVTGWRFRSYSSRETPGTMEDFSHRQIRAFPTLILYCDGVELGRHTFVHNSVEGIVAWGNKLLGVEGREAAIGKGPTIPQASGAPPPPQISNIPTPVNEDTDPDLTALREELERRFVSGEPLEVIYFGGGLPGARRAITPLRYCETRGRGYLIGLCHRSGIEKTFRLDRMHLPGVSLANGTNDFRILAGCLGSSRLLEGMLAQIARLGNLPMENALAAHLAQGGGFESFFDEYAYGGYTLELRFTSQVIQLSLGYEANGCETIHYEFTPGGEPRLSPGIATHYALYTGKSTHRP